MNAEPIHDELERLKDQDEDRPAPQVGSHEFTAVRDGVATANASLHVREVTDETLSDGGPEFGQGEIVLRIPFQDCGSPKGYLAAVLDAFGLEAQPENYPHKRREGSR